MRPIITLMSISLLCSRLSIAQDQTAFSSTLLQLEMQYYEAKTKSQKSRIALQKVNTYLSNHAELDEQIIGECKRIDVEELPSNEKSKYLWNSSLIYFLHQDFSKSTELLLKYQMLSKDTSQACQLLYLLAVSSSPYDSLQNSLLSTNVVEIYTCLQQEQAKDNHPNRYNWVSYIVPGGGMMLKGYPEKGSAAFGLNAGSALLIYALIHKGLYVNAFGYSMLTISKFYLGNINYTKKLVGKKAYKSKQKNAQVCHSKLEHLLEEYPIEFKLY